MKVYPLQTYLVRKLNLLQNVYFVVIFALSVNDKNGIKGKMVHGN